MSLKNIYIYSSNNYSQTILVYNPQPVATFGIEVSNDLLATIINVLTCLRDSSVINRVIKRKHKTPKRKLFTVTRSMIVHLKTRTAQHIMLNCFCV